jgi:hypothetical protein
MHIYRFTVTQARSVHLFQELFVVIPMSERPWEILENARTHYEMETTANCLNTSNVMRKAVRASTDG